MQEGVRKVRLKDTWFFYSMEDVAWLRLAVFGA